ncbi:uncharacterized protein [Pseudorasbora parva]|uniref:uncharacterized protein n=1 Tax=Pseudorasbora parva TaxID=51549 RepID=UPI00351E753B
MCFQYIPTISTPRSTIRRRRQRNTANLRLIPSSTNIPPSFSLGLWNCQSAVNKADFIPAFATHSNLNILALTETWIRPEDSATPAALSNNFSFSHTPRHTGRGGVTAPAKIHLVVIYRPPGQLGTFVEELDVLLSSFPEDGSPLVILGDFNIHLDKPNLGVIFDDQLSFKDHISKTARSCRFALHNIRKIRPFLTEHATQLLVQALVISRLDYCNALLAGLPSCAIKPLQMIQNAAARLVFNEPKRAHVTPLFISLHWLPLAARIKFKALTLAYGSSTSAAPAYFDSLLRVYTPTRSLRSANERRLVVPSQRGMKSLSRTFSFIVPGWWNDLPSSIRTTESLTSFKRQVKTHLFHEHLILH